MRVTVKGEWLAACGKGTADREVKVLNMTATNAAKGSGFETIYTVEIDGVWWTVAKCRLVGEP